MTGRTQAVTVGAGTSYQLEVDVDIPQGCCLGSILFTQLINDIVVFMLKDGSQGSTT